MADRRNLYLEPSVRRKESVGTIMRGNGLNRKGPSSKRLTGVTEWMEIFTKVNPAGRRRYVVETNANH